MKPDLKGKTACRDTLQIQIQVRLVRGGQDGNDTGFRCDCIDCTAVAHYIRSLSRDDIAIASLRSAENQETLRSIQPDWAFAPTLIKNTGSGPRLYQGLRLNLQLAGKVGLLKALRIVHFLGSSQGAKNQVDQHRRGFLRAIGVGAASVLAASALPRAIAAEGDPDELPLSGSRLEAMKDQALGDPYVRQALQAIDKEGYDLQTLKPIAFQDSGHSMTILLFQHAREGDTKAAAVLYKREGATSAAKVEFLESNEAEFHPASGLPAIHTTSVYFPEQSTPQPQNAAAFISCMTTCTGVQCIPAASRCTIGGPYVIVACFAALCGPAAWRCYQTMCRNVW